MRVIIAGGRDFNDYEFAQRKLDVLFSKTSPASIISGCAPGADSLGEKYAIENNIEVIRCPADWAAHGRAAGPIRNAAMAEIGTHLVAFWDGKSRGTKNMIETARAKGLEIRVIRL